MFAIPLVIFSHLSLYQLRCTLSASFSTIRFPAPHRYRSHILMESIKLCVFCFACYFFTCSVFTQYSWHFTVVFHAFLTLGFLRYLLLLSTMFRPIYFVAFSYHFVSTISKSHAYIPTLPTCICSYICTYLSWYKSSFYLHFCLVF